MKIDFFHPHIVHVYKIIVINEIEKNIVFI